MRACTAPREARSHFLREGLEFKYPVAGRHFHFLHVTTTIGFYLFFPLCCFSSLNFNPLAEDDYSHFEKSGFRG